MRRPLPLRRRRPRSDGRSHKDFPNYRNFRKALLGSLPAYRGIISAGCSSLTHSPQRQIPGRDRRQAYQEQIMNFPANPARRPARRISALRGRASGFPDATVLPRRSGTGCWRAWVQRRGFRSPAPRAIAQVTPTPASPGSVSKLFPYTWPLRGGLCNAKERPRPLGLRRDIFNQAFGSILRRRLAILLLQSAIDVVVDRDRQLLRAFARSPAIRLVYVLHGL